MRFAHNTSLSRRCVQRGCCPEQLLAVFEFDRTPWGGAGAAKLDAQPVLLLAVRLNSTHVGGACVLVLDTSLWSLFSVLCCHFSSPAQISLKVRAVTPATVPGLCAETPTLSCLVLHTAFVAQLYTSKFEHRSGHWICCNIFVNRTSSICESRCALCAGSRLQSWTSSVNANSAQNLISLRVAFEARF